MWHFHSLLSNRYFDISEFYLFTEKEIEKIIGAVFDFSIKTLLVM